ncbi:MAG: hypothetical protein RL490_2188 [Pseudomonadota bacterium]|jgi:uncharacterized protein involved in exopolysaccharide biosynthesis
MSLVQLVNILLARRWLILASLVTCVIVAVGVASQLPERYQARARVLLDIIKPDPVTGQIIGGPASRSYVKTQLELIQDYRIAGDVVDRLGWPQNPGVIAAWQEDTGGVGDLRRWASQRIIDSTRADMVETSNILEITYEGVNPGVARTIANMLREAYIDASLRFKTDSAGRTADWYREQADRAQKQLAIAEATKSKFEQDNGIIMGAGNSEAETVKLQGLQQALLSARSGQPAQQFEASRQATTSPVVDQLKLQLATLNDQISQAGERLGVEHPTYKTMLARRTLLQTQLSREEGVARAAGAAQSGSSSSSVAQLQAEYDAQKAKVLGMRQKLDELAQLDRDIALRKDQYEKAAARTAELRLEATQSESGLVVLGDAIVGGRPSFPNWPLIVGLATVLGLALGVVVALLTELAYRRVRGSDDLAFAGKAPVLAVIADQERSPMRDRLRRLLSRKSTSKLDWQPAQ